MLARSRGERQVPHDSMAKLEHDLSLPGQPELIPSDPLQGGRVGLGLSDFCPQLLDLVGYLGDLPVNSISFRFQMMQARKASRGKNKHRNRNRR